jgi:hypothetical protein
MEIEQLVQTFAVESRVLDAQLRQHPSLRSLFTREFAHVDRQALARAYQRLLKLKVDYVRFTVPALRAAGEALRDGDDEDRAWSKLFLGYASDETDTQGNYGHHVWALDDMKALGAPRELLEAAPLRAATAYGKFFIADAGKHPYAILGAKGVLEHFSIRVSDDLVLGLLASGVANAENAVSFFRHHGALDIDHVREGDRNLGKLRDDDKRFQILMGAHFTSGAYCCMLAEMLPT